MECIVNSEDSYLNSAAYTLKKAFVAAAEGDKGQLIGLTVQDGGVLIIAEVVHSIIGKLGFPGAFIEGVRAIGNIVLDASDNAESAIHVVASANTAKTLSENLMAHLEGGYAELVGDMWYAYSGYSKEFLNCLINLAVIRMDSEETYISWDCMKVGKTEKEKAESNYERAHTLFVQFSAKYDYYLSISK